MVSFILLLGNVWWGMLLSLQSDRCFFMMVWNWCLICKRPNANPKDLIVHGSCQITSQQSGTGARFERTCCLYMYSTTRNLGLSAVRSVRFPRYFLIRAWRMLSTVRIHCGCGTCGDFAIRQMTKWYLGFRIEIVFGRIIDRLIPVRWFVLVRLDQAINNYGATGT